MPREGAAVLSDLHEPTLIVAYEPRDRRGAYSVARLLEQYGDAKLTDLFQTLADCPRSPSVHDRCKAGYEGLEERWARARSEDTSMCAARAQPACGGAAGGTFSVQAGSRQAKRSRPRRGPTAYQAPRWPTDRLPPPLLRFTRKPGMSERRRVKRRGMSVHPEQHFGHPEQHFGG